MNTYFQFKQFRIDQSRAAMKVCTDACLFGAWVASKKISGSILDIGTGTGLLSLQLAQEHKHPIDAIEIEEAAALDANDNFTNSIWKDQLRLYHADIRTYQAAIPYDFIITNPPFFQNDLKSANERRNLALHSQSLSLTELADCIKNNLSSKGSFAILLPFHRKQAFIDIAFKIGFYPIEIMDVSQTEHHAPFRSMLLFSRSKHCQLASHICIKEKNNYSNSFSALLANYYLFM